MRVRAIKRGFYVKLREPGETFDVPKDMFSENWMERVKPGPQPKAESSSKPEPESAKVNAAASKDKEELPQSGKTKME